MDKQNFRKHMKRNRRSESAINRCVEYVGVFETFLAKIKPTERIEETSEQELEEFVFWSKTEDKNTNTLLWALAHYFTYLSLEGLAEKAKQLRKRERVQKPLPLKEIRGVEPEVLEKLARAEIVNVVSLLEATKTPQRRSQLSSSTTVPIETILEMAKLADLCRIPGVKGIRARLYFEAGVDTLEKMAQWDPVQLREMLIDFVNQTAFDGIAPWPKEVSFTVKTARKLPKVLEV
jgi:hypothetical protein